MRKGDLGWLSVLLRLLLACAGAALVLGLLGCAEAPDASAREEPAAPVAASAEADPLPPAPPSSYPRSLCIELSIASRYYAEAFPGSSGLDDKPMPVTPEEVEETQRVLRARVMGYGLPEPAIVTDWDSWMRVDVLVDRPRPQILEDLKEFLTSAGFFWVCLLPKEFAWEDRGPSIAEQDGLTWFTFFDTGGREWSASMVISKSDVIASWQDLKPNSRVATAPGQPAAVTFELEEPVRSGFEEITGSNIGRYLVFAFDDRFLACPRIMAAIPGKGVIPLVRETEDALGRAKRVSIMLNSGPLPLEVKWVKSWWAEDT